MPKYYHVVHGGPLNCWVCGNAKTIGALCKPHQTMHDAIKADWKAASTIFYKLYQDEQDQRISIATSKKKTP